MFLILTHISHASLSWDCKKIGHRAGDVECEYNMESNGPSNKKQIRSRKAQVAFSVGTKGEDRNSGKEMHETFKPQKRRDVCSRGNGLEQTIMEMLTNYEPTSAQHKPFWCRICRFQGINLEEYEVHIESELHREARQIERELSTCKLCNKEFTSPDQLREHKAGRAHKEKLENRSNCTSNNKRKRL